jgi:hypothetical protein
MQSALFIPTYIGSGRKSGALNVTQSYDHMTPLNYQGELPRCLASFCEFGVKLPIFILVVSESGLETEAAAKVQDICGHFSDDLDITIVDAEMAATFQARLQELGFEQMDKQVGLSSYGAIRNLALAIAAVCGLDVAIFFDDDQVVNAPGFAEACTYGLGGVTPDEVPILVKSGFYFDKQGRYTSPGKHKWYNRFWTQGAAFNRWINGAMSGARLTPSNNLFGGLCAIHRQAFERVAFDPWIPRGEDLDYLLNVLIYGGIVFFDNQWQITHLPPAEADTVQRFNQDVYRWIYEYHKVEFAKSQVDLYPIRPAMLRPYPGSFLDRRIMNKVRATALLRAVAAHGERKRGYLHSATRVRSEAIAYAEVFCQKYYDFQTTWPSLIAQVSEDLQLKAMFGLALPPEEAAKLEGSAPGEAALGEDLLTEVYREENERLLDFDLDLDSLTRKTQ